MNINIPEDVLVEHLTAIDDAIRARNAVVAHIKVRALSTALREHTEEKTGFNTTGLPCEKLGRCPAT